MDVRIEMDPGILHLGSTVNAPGKIRFDGTLHLLLDPANSTKLHMATRIPGGLLLLLFGIFTCATSDLFRRVFRSVERRDVFTLNNVRYLRWIGALIALGGVLMQVTIIWQSTATLAFARSNLAIEGISFLPSHRVGTWLGPVQAIVLGLIVIVLAEVFNQGVVLKQDSDLTV
jgi:uncharacterized membrane protein YidH (DUF202 family)